MSDPITRLNAALEGRYSIEREFAFPQGIIFYDVSSDGERLVILTNNPEAPAREIRVIQNFFEELKRLVPN